MDPAQAGRRSLGQLAVSRGLVTDDQLEDALLEQNVTRKRLGAILTSRGMVTGEELTQVLVDQVDADLGPGQPPAPGPSRGGLGRWLRRSPKTEDPPVEPRDDGIASLAASVEELRVLRAASQADLANLVRELDRAELELARANAEIADRDARIAELERTAETVQGHLLFFPRPGKGHRLIERLGDPPGVGGTVTLEGARFDVTGHGVSPFPSDGRVCVHLRARP